MIPLLNSFFFFFNWKFLFQGSSQLRDPTRVSCLGRRILYPEPPRESLYSVSRTQVSWFFSAPQICFLPSSACSVSQEAHLCARASLPAGFWATSAVGGGRGRQVGAFFLCPLPVLGHVAAFRRGNSSCREQPLLNSLQLPLGSQETPSSLSL